MTHHDHAHGLHIHDSAPAPFAADLPRSVMAASALARVGFALILVAVLWLAILWAIAKP